MAFVESLASQALRSLRVKVDGNGEAVCFQFLLLFGCEHDTERARTRQGNPLPRASLAAFSVTFHKIIRHRIYVIEY
jgi:hypothetical protein